MNLPSRLVSLLDWTNSAITANDNSDDYSPLLIGIGDRVSSVLGLSLLESYFGVACATAGASGVSYT